MMPRLPYRAILALGIATLTLAAIPGAAFAHTPAVSLSQAAPTFVFPSNGQSFPLNGTMLFQVQPMSGAKGYLWSFVQGGAIMYQNLAWTGRLDGATYSIKKGSAAERRLHGGSMQVWVRALMGSGQWSESSSLTIQLQGGGKPPITHPQPPTPQPQIHAGDVLYTADVSKLAGSKEWKHVGGMLVNDGTGQSTILLPYKSPVNNYAVEAEIQSLPPNTSAEFAFGIRSRMTGSSGGYWGIIAPNSAALQYGDGQTFASAQYSFDNDFHIYRLEVRGNDVRLLVDGTPLVEQQDNHYLSGNQAGLYDNRMQINVRAIRVIAL